MTIRRKVTEENRVLDLGRHIVADPKVCHGKPTYRGTRIMVWQVLEALADGESVDHLVGAWGGALAVKQSWKPSVWRNQTFLATMATFGTQM